MSIFPRALLEQAFPNNPRLVASFERLDKLLSTTNAEGVSLADQLAALASDTSGFQVTSAFLSAIAALGETGLGVVEVVGPDEAILHQVDSNDDGCLVPRNKLMSYVGKGTTAARPALSAQRRSVYFDTTLNANGKPIFWTGTAWVDATGATV